MNRLVAVVGPTASGKTRLAIDLALAFNGEIINADSRQIYRHMTTGTAKPTSGELSTVPHHLIDILDPDEPFSLSDYQERAFKSISDINERQKVPFFVGGTGQYVWAVLENWQIPRVSPDQGLRENLKKQASEAGSEALYRELLSVDPDAAAKIDLRNTRRVIRALEVCRATGTPFSRFQVKKKPPFDALIIGLTLDREKLYQRIDERVDGMIRCGLVEEVENLIKIGYDLSLPSMSAIGYRQIALYIRKELALEEAIKQIKFETHRYVRQQYNWFRLKNPRIKWFDVETNPEPEIKTLVSEFLAENE